MGMFQDLAEGFVTGFAVAAAQTIRYGHLQHRFSVEMATIEHLCQQLGWTVDEREASSFILHFSDPLVRTRRVIVVPHGAGVLIGTSSEMSIAAAQVPHQILSYLLVRNSDMGGPAWQASIMKNGGAMLCVRQFAFIAGLDCHSFKIIVEHVLQEVQDFDAKMRAAGIQGQRA